MRHKEFPSARRHRRSFVTALWTAAASTGAAALLGYLMALSALAGWVLAAIITAVAVSVWLESRLARHTAPPPAPFYFLPQQRSTD
ncbi:hypothetical protein [Glycomyces buryatensis]|uniref:Uncharacterized protein n=1 Tax=Glycomyces buryatensis TaxID=2570927 RepID=A0A4V6T6M7_9ACTN|nr:hypothetical protein [Glycomyces buryatensis]THV38606.1 hypothetical protein FAB82_19435 [Glycomyces buryatensis]